MLTNVNNERNVNNAIEISKMFKVILGPQLVWGPQDSRVKAFMIYLKVLDFRLPKVPRSS